MKKIGCYKNHPVFIEKQEDNTWTIRLEHHRYGPLEKTGLSFKPRIGMAKRFFKSKIKNLNNGENNVQSRKYQTVNRATISGTGERVTPDEIGQWL